MQGAATMLLGFAIQLHSHAVLAGLSRRSSARARGAVRAGQEAQGDQGAQEGQGIKAGQGAQRGQGAQGGVEQGYSIPMGGLFRWVSCPHYLGEIIIYAGR